MNISQFSKLLIASALAVSLIACGQKTSEESIASARQFIEDGKPDSAIIELKNAVQLAPKDAAVRVLLGKMYLETGQLPGAEKELTRAQELGAKGNDIFPLLAQVYYYSDQFETAVKPLEDDELTDPSAISSTTLFQYLASLRSQTSLERLELSAINLKLSDEDLLVAKAYDAFNQRSYEQVSKLLKQLKDNKQRLAETTYLQALLSYQQGDFVGAVAGFTQVKQLVPVLNSTNFQLIEALIKNKQLDEAEKATDVLFRLNKENPLVNLYKGNIAYQKKQYEKALGHSEKAIQNGVDTVTVRMIAGVSAYKLESLEKAYVHLSRLAERSGFQNEDINRILAHVQLSLGYTQEAANTLKTIVDLNSNDVGMFSETGMKLAAIGDVGGANELLGMASQLDDSNMSTKLRAVMINIGSDENAVIEGLKELIAQDKSLDQGWMQLAMAHVRKGDEKSALDVADEWFQSEPANGKALMGVIYFVEDKAELAVSALNAALSIEPNHMGANQYLLQAYEKLKRDDELYKQAQQILSFAPSNMPALVALVSSGQRLDRRESAEALIRGITEQNKDDIEPYVAQALSARLHGETKNVIDILTNHTERLNALGFMTLGDAYLTLGQSEQALTTYQLWQKKSPNILIPRLRIIGMNELKGDNEQALKMTEEALTLFPKRAVLQMLKLNYLTKLGKMASAKDVLQEIKNQGVSEQAALLNFYEGQLALSEKNYPQAEALMASHHKNSPSFTSAMMLAKAMQGNGQVAQAQVVLEAQQAKQDKPSTRLRHSVGEFYLYNGLYQEAIKQYEKLLELEGESPASLNNFAYALLGVKQLDNARDMAQKALALSPNDPSILDTLGWIEFESGNGAEAFKHLTAAVKFAPKANVIMLHLAEVQISFGQKEQAKTLLRKLVKPTKTEATKRDALLKGI